jgi:hypothetical protein
VVLALAVIVLTVTTLAASLELANDSAEHFLCGPREPMVCRLAELILLAGRWQTDLWEPKFSKRIYERAGGLP